MKHQTPNTETQHTPGPWHVEKHVGRWEIWPQDKGQAHCYVGTVQTKQDAQLIASAPDLLNLIGEVSEYFAAIDAFNPTKKHGSVGDGLRLKLKAAIAKATGQPVSPP